VPSWDVKHEANQYFIDHGVPTTFLHISFLYENFIDYNMGPKLDDGAYTFGWNMGDRYLPMVAAEDVGYAAATIFGDQNYIGQYLYVASEHYTGNEIAEAFSNAFNIDAKFEDYSDESYRKLE
jgi:hypothetical protein